MVQRSALTLSFVLTLASGSLSTRAQEAAAPSEEAALLMHIDAAIQAHPDLDGRVRWALGTGTQERHEHGRLAINPSALALHVSDGAVLFVAADHITMLDPLPAPGSLLRRTMRTPMTDYAAIARGESTMSAHFIPRIVRHEADADVLELLPRTAWPMIERIVVRVNTTTNPGRIERVVYFDGLGGHGRIDLSALTPSSRAPAITEPAQAGARVVEF